MVVEKIELDGGPVVVVEVHPAHFPPVKYKGKTCVHIGPRRGVANEDDERKLFEKRASHVLTFDATPCFSCNIDDLDTALFRQQYLPKAYPDDVLRTDTRDVKLQLQSLGFFDTRYDCATWAGLLLFGKNIERRLPGAYIQYVKFDGTSRAADIANEYKFAGNLMTVLQQLDTFVATTIANSRPIKVSALREDTVFDYPSRAIRELLMNAVCHRDYEGNGPIQFYQYDDRIEILNPGGLYGKANLKNFPWVNDYRNGVIAEAMKVLGFVNRFSRGILRVQEELSSNGNPEAKFNLNLETAFLVSVEISSRAKETEVGDKEHVKDDTTGSESTTSPAPNGRAKDRAKDRAKELSPTAIKLHNALKETPSANRLTLAAHLNISPQTLYRATAELKKKGIIARKGGRKFGHWVILAEI